MKIRNKLECFYIKNAKVNDGVLGCNVLFIYSLLR